MTTDPRSHDDALTRLWNLVTAAPWPASRRFAEALIDRGMFPTPPSASADEFMAVLFADPGAFAIMFRETILPDLAGQDRAEAVAAIRVIDATAPPAVADRPDPGPATAAEVSAAELTLRREQFAALVKFLDLVHPYTTGDRETLGDVIARMPEVEQITARALAEQAGELMDPSFRLGGTGP